MFVLHGNTHNISLYISISNICTSEYDPKDFWAEPSANYRYEVSLQRINKYHMQWSSYDLGCSGSQIHLLQSLYDPSWLARAVSWSLLSCSLDDGMFPLYPFSLSWVLFCLNSPFQSIKKNGKSSPICLRAFGVTGIPSSVLSVISGINKINNKGAIRLF